MKAASKMGLRLLEVAGLLSYSCFSIISMFQMKMALGMSGQKSTVAGEEQQLPTEVLAGLPPWQPAKPGYQVQPWEASPPALTSLSSGNGGGPPPEPLVQYGNPFLFGETARGVGTDDAKRAYSTSDVVSSKGDIDRRQCMTTCLLQVSSYYSSEPEVEASVIARAQLGVIAGCNPSALGAPSVVAGVPLLMGSKLKKIDFKSPSVQKLVSAMASNALAGESGSGTVMAAHILINQLLNLPESTDSKSGDSKSSMSSSKDKDAAAEDAVLIQWLMVASLQSGANRQSVNGLLLDMLLTKSDDEAKNGAKGSKSMSSKAKNGGDQDNRQDLLLKSALIANSFSDGQPSHQTAAPAPPEAYIADVHHKCMQMVIASKPPPQTILSLVKSCTDSEIQARQSNTLQKQHEYALKMGNNGQNPLMLAMLAARGSGSGDSSKPSSSKGKESSGGVDNPMLALLLSQNQGGSNNNQMVANYLAMKSIESGDPGKSSNMGKSSSSKDASSSNDDSALLAAMSMSQPPQTLGSSTGDTMGQNNMLANYAILKGLASNGGGSSSSSSLSKKSSGDGGANNAAIMAAFMANNQQRFNGINSPNTLNGYFLGKMLEKGTGADSSKGSTESRYGSGGEQGDASSMILPYLLTAQNGYGPGGNSAANNMIVGHMLASDPKAKPEDIAPMMGVIASGAMIGHGGLAANPVPGRGTGSAYSSCVTVVLNGLLGQDVKGEDIKPNLDKCVATGVPGFSNGDLACMECLNRVLADSKAKSATADKLLPELNPCVTYTFMQPNTHLDNSFSSTPLNSNDRGPQPEMIEISSGLARVNRRARLRGMAVNKKSLTN